MANKRRISFFLIAMSGILLAVLIAIVMWRIFDNRLVWQLLSKRSRTAAFAKLIEKNKIYNLPAEFSFTADGSSIDCFEATDKTGARLVVAMVMYPVGVRGVRACSFVFDASGHCVLWSRDSMRSDGGLVDFTGDGCLEKFVSFPVEDGRDWPSDKFQVFIISSGKKELVLEIVYNIGTPPLYRKDYDISVWVAPTWPGQLSRIELSEDSVKRVELVWSAEKHSFVVKGPKSSSKWRIIIPVPTENPVRP